VAGRHQPPDHTRGDERTIGGYMAVHARPAAFEGSDGFSYSVEICADPTGERQQPWGAYFLFLRWKRQGEQGIAGHLESDFLVRGASEAEVRHAIGALPLGSVKATLDQLVAAQAALAPTRKWWDVMRDDD
jgi:hypothetical protein